VYLSWTARDKRQAVQQQQQKETKQMLNKLFEMFTVIVMNLLLSPVIIGEFLFPSN
jgi:hypothetical protein